MAKFLEFCAIVLILAMVSVSCRKGGNGSSNDSNNPTTPVTGAGEPTVADWTRLAAQLGAVAADGVVSTLTSGTVVMSSVGGVRTPSLAAPSTGRSSSNAYFCCALDSTSATASSFLTLETVASLVQGNPNLMKVSQTVIPSGATMWIGNGGSWRVTSSTLQVTGDVVIENGVVRPKQDLRIFGAFLFQLANGELKRADIDVVLTFPNIENGSSSVTATGPVGPVVLAPSQVLVSPGTASRCSRPLEGCSCVNGCTGTAPCTLWPKCPA